MLLSFGLCYCHLVNFTVVWYIFPRFGLFDQEKSGNPVRDTLHEN
jgi:hypothetical protein